MKGKIMKKTMVTFLLTLTMVLSNTANAGVSAANQAKISNNLSKVNMQSYWAQDISLWVENNPGFSKNELEGIGETLCSATKDVGFYVITFWRDLSGGGKITKVRCY